MRCGGTHTVEDWTECAQTHTQTDRQTDKSENTISASSLHSVGRYNYLSTFATEKIQLVVETSDIG